MLDAPDANALFASGIVRANGTDIGSTIDQLDTKVTNIYDDWALALPSYTDQVLPFNVTLAGANEYGAMTAAKILGIEILNEGSGISVDDAVMESQATFVARAIEPLQAIVSPFTPGLSLSPATRIPRAGASGRPALPGLPGLPGLPTLFRGRPTLWRPAASLPCHVMVLIFFFLSSSYL